MSEKSFYTYRKVTPSKLDPRQSVNSQRPEVSVDTFNRLANLSKKVYPLNCFQQPSTKVRKSDSKIKPTQVPRFMEEYVQAVLKPKSRPQSVLKLSRKKGIGPAHERSASTESQACKDSSGIPKLNYSQIKHEKNTKSLHSNEANGLYKPHQVRISQRSKMVLYSPEPMQLKPYSYKNPLRYQKSAVLKPKKKSLDFRSFNPKIKNDPSDLEINNTEAPAFTFGEKLLRVKELALDLHLRNA